MFYHFHINVLEYLQSIKLKPPYNVMQQNRDKADEVKLLGFILRT